MKQTSNQRITIDAFEEDNFPGKPKILFIGLPTSSHTHSWIDLLTGTEFNIRLFSSDYGIPPRSWKVRTYVTVLPPLEEAGKYRKNLYPTALELEETALELERYLRKKKYSLFPLRAAKWGLNIFARRFKLPELYYDYTNFLHRSLQKKWSGNNFQATNAPISPALPKPKPESPQAWLAQVIRAWQPDIIHALGCFDSQGGDFLYETIKEFDLDYKGKVIMQLRGGSDLTLRIHDPDRVEKIKAICNLASQILSDNPVNFCYLEEMGISSDKFSPIAPLPGTGGIDLDLMQSVSTGLPSQRERVILYPKAYECIWSKALPAFEGIRLAWEKIRPCKIIMTATNEESQTWFRTLPEEISQCCELLGRIPHVDLFKIMGQARVLLGPSLVDGIPNTLYEAMACGAFPIVSPLVTIKPVVKNEENVLFARNLYPEEIAAALVRAMNDDALVDRAAEKNWTLVRRLANREVIRKQVIEFYNSICYK
jgi:glycosyltransferase involved in cell wall biosynthesis